LKDNPTPSSKLLTKSSSTSPKSFLEETNTFHNYVLEFENFYFDLEDISNGSTTTHSDISLSEYDSFTFDLLNDQCPPSDRSDFTHEEFADELAHIITPQDYNCFYFWNLPNPGELISIFNSGIRENLSSTTSVNLPVEDDHSPLLAYVIPACCDDDDDYNFAITPILSTEETENSLRMGDEHLDTIPAMESDEVIKSSVEDLVPIPSESEGIPDTMCDVHLVNNPTPLEAKDHFEIVTNSNDDISSSDDDSLYKENIEYVEASPHNSELVSLEEAEIVISEVEEIEDDNLRKKLLNVHLLIANIEALKDNPTPSSKLLTKSSSTSPKSFLEETNTFHNSILEFENFCFDLEDISNGSTTTHSDISLSEYDSFTFDLLNDQCPPSDRSDFTHEEFADELAHIISPQDYDCFYFWNLPDPGELISIFNSGIRENLSSTTSVNLLVLTYPVIPSYLHSFRNKDTIFDPGITINRIYSFKPGLSHRCGDFKKFNTHRSHLNE
nr:hypothetical protein [Tanacetum cinerariifolium]